MKSRILALAVTSALYSSLGNALFADTPEALEKTAREWIEEQKEGKS